MGLWKLNNHVETMKTENDLSTARRELNTRMVAQVAARERKRSLLLISMTAPALGLLALVVYRFVANVM